MMLGGGVGGGGVWVHMCAACVGEVFGCVMRLPFEVVKQREQESGAVGYLHVLRQTHLCWSYVSLLFRDIPFSVIQMSALEFFKKMMSGYNSVVLSGFQTGYVVIFIFGRTDELERTNSDKLVNTDE